MVPVPWTEDKVLTGKQVTEEQISFLTPNVTTNQEVLERLGNPTVIWEDARVFVYNWAMRQGIVFWAVYGSGFGTGDIPKQYLLFIKFDEQDRVQRFERAVCPMNRSYSECLTEWVRSADQTSPRNMPDQME
jgi:outer membrane protein assembly factor BamE (lipoprotein component of BamABCDE complex)